MSCCKEDKSEEVDEKAQLTRYYRKLNVHELFVESKRFNENAFIFSTNLLRDPDETKPFTQFYIPRDAKIGATIGSKVELSVRRPNDEKYFSYTKGRVTGINGFNLKIRFGREPRGKKDDMIKFRVRLDDKCLNDRYFARLRAFARLELDPRPNLDWANCLKSQKLEDNLRLNIVPSYDEIRSSFEFDLNKKQVSSIQKALKSKIHVIKGCIGSGKTSTLLVIANWLVTKEQRRVLICTSYQSSIDHIAKELSRLFPNLKVLQASKGDDSLHRVFENRTTYREMSSLDRIVIDKLHVKARKANLPLKKLIEGCSDYLRFKVSKECISKVDIICCTLSQATSTYIRDEKFDSLLIDDSNLANELDLVLASVDGLDHIVVTERLTKESRASPKEVLHKNYRVSSMHTEPDNNFCTCLMDQINDNNTREELKWLHSGIETKMIIGNCSRQIITKEVLNEVNNLSEDWKGRTAIIVDMPFDINDNEMLELEGVEVGTILDFIGQERDHIILSRHQPRAVLHAFVNEIQVDFASNDRSLLMALTRARQRLTIIDNTIPLIDQNVDATTEAACPLWNSLIDFYERHELIQNRE